ncbi:MAG: ATP synthase F0 subunit B [Myxococcales bacterium]|nr:ATP synthase F0 subunit B [Myxococcales bacterium]
MPRKRFFALLALLLSIPAVAMAAGGGGDHGDFEFSHLFTVPEIRDVFLGSIINFGLLAFVLWKFAHKPFGSFLKTRRSEMEEAIKEASEMKEKAEARYKEYTERLGTLDQELKKLKDDIERAAEEDKKKIMAAADESTKRLKVETESLIEQHAAALGQSVRREVVQAAVDAAEELLTKQIGAHDQQRLADDFKQRVTDSAQERA